MCICIHYQFKAIYDGITFIMAHLSIIVNNKNIYFVFDGFPNYNFADFDLFSKMLNYRETAESRRVHIDEMALELQRKTDELRSLEKEVIIE